MATTPTSTPPPASGPATSRPAASARATFGAAPMATTTTSAGSSAPSEVSTVVTRLNVTNTATFGGSFLGNYAFNTSGGSGSATALVTGYGPGTLGTAWCGKYPASAPGGCVPASYTAHPNGKFDIPVVTELRSSTWGAIKQLYR